MIPITFLRLIFRRSRRDIYSAVIRERLSSHALLTRTPHKNIRYYAVTRNGFTLLVTPIPIIRSIKSLIKLPTSNYLFADGFVVSRPEHSPFFHPSRGSSWERVRKRRDQRYLGPKKPSVLRVSVTLLISLSL